MSDENSTPTTSRSGDDSSTDRAAATGYPFLFRFAHWLLTGSIIILILTGFSMHAGSRPDWSLLNGKVPWWLWNGRVHYWHTWAALVFTPALVAACWVYVRRRVYFRPTHVILLVGGLLTVVTGFLLANPPDSAALYSASLWIHAIVGLVVIPLWFLWHALMGLTRYLRVLVPAFHPWARPEVLGMYGLLVLTVITTSVFLNGWPMVLPWRDLVAGRIDAREGVELTELPWDDAKPLMVQLANGNGMDAGRTPLELRALHDGNELFVRAVWADDDEEYRYWPWKKTDDGWEYMQTSANDECRCYEDKFSLVFPIQPDGDFERFGCAASCHMHSDYGWGYKGTGRLIDVWHWKSARTGSVGQVDDKYWDRADFDNKDIGRHGDPKEGGGYVKNRSEDKDHPLFLPDSPDAVSRGAIPKERAVEYTEAAGSAITPGTIVPGVVTDAFVGDRGNVTCVSEHKDGRWTLLIRRPLKTESAYDVQFVPGRRHAFGCAAFDHSGKRHAYALPVFHLRVAE
jgi:hypothetical protein